MISSISVHLLLIKSKIFSSKLNCLISMINFNNSSSNIKEYNNNNNISSNIKEYNNNNRIKNNNNISNKTSYKSNSNNHINNNRKWKGCKNSLL
jgi:uncharacterized membrane protein